MTYFTLRNSVAKRLTSATAIAVVAVCAGGAVAYTQFRLQNRVTIPQPLGWIPFQADVTVIQPEGTNLAGRFFRNSEGSTRLETYRVGYPDDRVISITNISLNRHFTYADRKWVSRPLQLPPNGWKPLARWEGNPEYTKSRFKIDGRALYQHTLVQGDELFFEDPELNFFPVVQQRLTDGRRESYTNIIVGEPSIGLFEPPYGANVEGKVNPGGIVFTPPGAPPPDHLPSRRR